MTVVNKEEGVSEDIIKWMQVKKRIGETQRAKSKKAVEQIRMLSKRLSWLEGVFAWTDILKSASPFFFKSETKNW